MDTAHSRHTSRDSYGTARNFGLRDDDNDDDGSDTTEVNGQNGKRQLPLEEDIMQLARLGEIGAIQKLFDSGKYDVTYRDEEGITPLHWAALNNHYALCHFLIQTGADVNAKGGAMAATPGMWAVRNCNYYVVDLLLQHGADPLKTDDQGFNMLQNAAMDGNVFQVMMLLHQDVPVDVVDPKGHTSLMWAAYKGFPACVEALLQWGASISAQDENGFTALHWALVRGSQACVQKLIESGADKFALTTDGKSPWTVARDMNTLSQWNKALADCGYDDAGIPTKFPLMPFVKDRKTFYTRFLFFWPWLILFCCIYIVSNMPIYVGLPLAGTVFFAMQSLAQGFLRWAPSNFRRIQFTPFITGIFAGSLFWVGVQYLRKILPVTFSAAPGSNIAFAAFYALCSYFYGLALVEDPGFITRTTSRVEQKATIRSMLDAQEFDEKHFCIPCSVRKPLRSKHCKRCGRCVAKQDHNCIGVNNHRHFFFYVLTLEVGLFFLIWLTYKYLSILPPSNQNECNILEPRLCAILNEDPFTIVTVAWACLQLVWVSMLVVVQLLQICRAVTTRENMKGFDLEGPAGAVASALLTGTPSAEGGALADSHEPSAPDNAARQRPRQSWFQQWKTMLGIDTFIAIAFHGSRADEVRAQRRRNPFTRGLWINMKDFFYDSEPIFKLRSDGKAMLGGEVVDYTRLYEAPPRRRTRILPFEGPGGEITYQSVTEEEEIV